jgi:carbon-monoxide dehydrogenase medium subunit
MMRQGLIAPETLVNVGNVTGLRGITREGGWIRIGAATPLGDVAESPLIRELAPGVSEACSMVGNPRIRNVATLGGNLAEADYASDPPAALAAYDAYCHVEGHQGSRQVPVAELITGFYETVLAPSEIITSTHVPISECERRGVYLKYRTRSSEDRACVGVAATAEFQEGVIRTLRVVVAAVAPTLQSVEDPLQAVRGQVLDDQTADLVAEAYSQSIQPMEDARGSAWYRRRMIRVFVKRALMQLAHASQPREENR